MEWEVDVRYIAAFLIMFGTTVFADEFNDYLNFTKKIIDEAFIEVSDKVTLTEDDIESEKMNFAYLLGKKEAIDSIIQEYFDANPTLEGFNNLIKEAKKNIVIVDSSN